MDEIVSISKRPPIITLLSDRKDYSGEREREKERERENSGWFIYTYSIYSSWRMHSIANTFTWKSYYRFHWQWRYMIVCVYECIHIYICIYIYIPTYTFFFSFTPRSTLSCHIIPSFDIAISASKGCACWKLRPLFVLLFQQRSTWDEFFSSAPLQIWNVE